MNDLLRLPYRVRPRKKNCVSQQKIEIDQASESYIAPIANIGVLLRILCEYDIKENIRTEEGEVSIREK